jgi:hypothetical protein
MAGDREIQGAVEGSVAMQAHYVGDRPAGPHQQYVTRMVPLRRLRAFDPTTTHTRADPHAARRPLAAGQPEGRIRARTSRHDPEVTGPGADADVARRTIERSLGDEGSLKGAGPRSGRGVVAGAFDRIGHLGNKRRAWDGKVEASARGAARDQECMFGRNEVNESNLKITSGCWNERVPGRYGTCRGSIAPGRPSAGRRG